VPLYEYECDACGDRFEELVGTHGGVKGEDVRCPSCGEAAVHRLISPYAAVHRQLTLRQQKRMEAQRAAAREARSRGGSGG
jgi:putative FmdB family regulatory protein